MPSTKRSIVEANGAGGDEPPASQDEHRPAPAKRAPDLRQVCSTDERKPAASDGSPVDASSLLILGPDCLSHLTRHLDVVSLAKFEGVCKQFRQMAVPRWETLDAEIPAKGRSEAESPRLRVIRHHMAASACREIEPKIVEDGKYEEDANSRCQFPGNKYVLDADITSLEVKGDEELFCQFVEKSSGTLLAQGYFSTVQKASGYSESRLFFIKDMDLSNWPAMKDLVETLEGPTDLRTDLRTPLEKIMEDLSVVVVAISKGVCPEIRVISAVNKIEERDSFGMQGRRRWYSREMNTMFIHPPTTDTSTGPYIISRMKRIVTSFKVGDKHEREWDGQVLLKIETYD